MNKPRRAKSRLLEPLPLAPDETKCGICLDEVKYRGKIGPCSHLYCFSCLREWSKLNNTCPQCKRIFRSITKVNFTTGASEDKIFIKDKTLPTGFISSEDEYEQPYFNSSDNSDNADVSDFIVYNDEPGEKYSDSEEEATFTQHPGKRRRVRRVFSPSPEKSKSILKNQVNTLDDESPICTEKSKKQYQSNKRCHILSDSNSETELSGPDLFSEPETSPSSRKHYISKQNSNNIIKPTSSSSIPCSSKNRDYSSFVSPQSSKKRKLDTSISPSGRTGSSVAKLFTSPKYNKLSRWSHLDQRVRNNKKKNTQKKKKHVTISINTIPTPAGRRQTTSQWLSTVSSSAGSSAGFKSSSWSAPSSASDKENNTNNKENNTNNKENNTNNKENNTHNKENTPPSRKLTNGKFKIRKSLHISPNNTLSSDEDPEQYFTKMLDEL